MHLGRGPGGDLATVHESPLQELSHDSVFIPVDTPSATSPAISVDLVTGGADSGSGDGVIRVHDKMFIDIQDVDIEDRK
jgi:hypothetical protein